ncbi:FecR family protein [Bacteroides sp.]
MNNLSEEIIAKFLMGKCTEEELIQVNLWIKESDENAHKLFRMEEIYHLGKERHALSQKRMDMAEKSLYKRIAEEEAKRNRRLTIHRWMKYAAIITVILLTGTGISYWIGQNDLNNNWMMAVASETSVEEVTLPDGTKVWLNQSAILKYPREFSEKERNVYLEGEAYFEVTKNKARPFIVKSEAMQVKVLGTIFNFKSKKSCNSAEATLIEGEIEVKGNNEEGMIILSPGQKAELNRANKRLTVKQVDARLDAVWHDNLIPFEKADIYSIAKTLERFYNVKIILSPDLKIENTYSGVLKRKDSINSVLKSLKNSIPINYKIVGNSIFISAQTEK